MMAPPPIDTLDRWMEQPPEDAPASWCLPGWGGPIKVRAFDQASCTFTPVRHSERWAIETCVVPLAPTDAYPGPVGLLVAGDCVVFVNDFGDVDDAHHGSQACVEAWMPQRILESIQMNEHSQIVVSVIDRHYGNPKPDHVELIEKRFLDEAVLIKDKRRAVLERFMLNVDCPVCAARGRAIQYGMPIGPPLGDEQLGGCTIEINDPDYICGRCEAGWKVNDDGALVVVALGGAKGKQVPNWATFVEAGSYGY